MIKIFLSKANNFIQWTKKWPICHFFVIVFSAIFLYCSFCEIFFENNSFTNYILAMLLGSTIILYLMSIYILPIVLIISIIEHITKHRFETKNNVLLKNKKYDIYYNLFCLIIFISISTTLFSPLFLYCIFFLIVYIVILLIFFIIRNIIFFIIDIIIKLSNYK